MMPHPQVTGGLVNITATVTDNIQVDNIIINITDPTGTVIYYTSMNYSNIDEHYFEKTYTTIGVYGYYITANDSSNHQTISDIYHFNISSDI